MEGKKQSRNERAGGGTLVIVGLCLLAPSLLHNGFSAVPSGGMALGGMICLGLGIISISKSFFHSRQLPKQEVMRLAEERQGLLTLSEIATALDLDPEIVRRTLKELSKAGIATQRWQEFRKNLWEFPDYMKLPISESIELAKAKGGKRAIDDLVAAGRSREIARQTLDTLSDKGLAQPNPSAGPGEVIVTTQ